MANPQHLSILAKGALEWNSWLRQHSPHLREENFLGTYRRYKLFKAGRIRDGTSLEADLTDADLRRADLRGINLYSAHLDGADLRDALVSSANLDGATLRRTKLQDANLSRSDLSGANLENSDLRRACLEGADFSGADLSRANLSEAVLTDAIVRDAQLEETVFDRAWVGNTVFAGLDLRQAIGLTTLRHSGPSSVGVDTIYLSLGQLPQEFLRSAGVPETLVTFQHSLAAAPIAFHSCFISYSSKDQRFVTMLHNDLQAAGVRCWYAPKDLKIGEQIRGRLEESIRLHDKVLVVLSRYSIRSPWVETEVEAALERERQHQGLAVIFPVRVDDAAMRTRRAWAADIRRRKNIADFSGWEQPDSYSRAFARLLSDLKAPSRRPVQAT